MPVRHALNKREETDVLHAVLEPCHKGRIDLAVIALGVVSIFVMGVVILLRILLLLDGRHPLLLGEGVDIGSNDETNEVKEWDPSMRWQEPLCKGQSDRAGNPADFHNWEESSSDHCLNILLLSGTSNNGHTGEVDHVLDGCNDEIAHKDLQDLGSRGGTTSERALKDVDEEVSERCRDEGAVDSHHRNSWGEIAAMLLITCDDGGDELLKGRECTRRHHLRLKRVPLEHVQVRLDISLSGDFSSDRHDGQIFVIKPLKKEFREV